MFADHVRADDALRRKVLPPVISAFHRSIPCLAGCGFPVIVDHVIESRLWAAECARVLQGYDAFFVGIHCPLEVLEERERKRGDRTIGFARWQFDRVHRYGEYDLTIDTSISSPDHSAEILVSLLSSNHAPRSFERIRLHATQEEGESERSADEKKHRG